MESNWSVPETEVLASIGELLDGDESAVLATVVDVEGSAYRRPGAKMLVTSTGEGLGGITAGCLEGDVRGLAAEVLDTGDPRVETYDLMNDDDVWGLGVGCNGVIDVLLEPIDESFRPVVEASAAGEDVGVVTVVDGPDSLRGTRAVYRPGEGFVSGGDLRPELRDEVEPLIRDLTDAGKSGTVSVETADGTATVFLDGVAAPPTLVVLGHGHDVEPVTDLAKNCDFRVTVVTFRGAMAETDRFPHADHVLSTSPSSLREACTFDEDTYVVAMTHNFVDDRLALEELLETPVSYIGLLGPRERYEELREAMAEDGTTLSEGDADRIFTPVGLDLGGGAPYQIAHSIVAEILAVHNDREPKHMKEREGPIHTRVEHAN